MTARTLLAEAEAARLAEAAAAEVQRLREAAQAAEVEVEVEAEVEAEVEVEVEVEVELAARRVAADLSPRFNRDDLHACAEKVYGGVEYIYALLEAYRVQKRWRAVEMFREIDKDRDGNLSVDELVRFVQRIVPDVGAPQVRAPCHQLSAQ
jgi:hypothetical protein